MRALITGLAAALLLASAPAADPPVPAGKLVNSAYTNWAKFPKGTAVTLRSVSETAGQKSEVVMTTTLADLTPAKAVLETVLVTKAAGREFKAPPTKVDLARLVDAPPGYKPGQAKKAPGVVEEAEKKVTVAGREYRAKYVKVKTDAGGTAVVSEAWTSDDVPGMVLKSVSTTAGQYATTATTELVEVKRPGKK